MDITAAEQALTRFAAERLGLTVDESVFRGSVPEGLTGVAVRFESGIPGTDRPAEFTARIFGIFDEPDEAREFAERLWGGLPKYVDGKEMDYTWKEKDVLGYDLESQKTTGSQTVITNKPHNRGGNPARGGKSRTGGTTLYPFDDYETPLGVDVVINHVGDCFD